jgi:hypothetical protein
MRHKTGKRDRERRIQRAEERTQRSTQIVRREMPVLHNALTKQGVLSGEQILHEIVTASIGVEGGAGKMMIDSHARRPAEIIRNGKDFVSRFTLTDQPLRVRTCRANRKQFRGDPDKP